MLELGIDEITLVLQLSPKIKDKMTSLNSWQLYAEHMIKIFIDKSGFETIFGDRIPEKQAPKGYTTAYTFGLHNFYLAVAYHEYHLRMGVAIKFSALALDHYCVESDLNVYEFLQMIQDDFYTIRLSRVDLCVDYIDEDINVSTIYQNLKNNRIGIFREHISKKTGEVSYRKTDMQYQGFIKGQEVPTIYLGAPASMSRLRIYDKKQEQIDRNGSKLDIARKCKNWVRFEGVFRHEYSHQLTDELLKINSKVEFLNLIACTMIQKFRLMYIDNGVVDCDTEYSQILLDSINNKNFVLKAPSSKNYDIAKSLIHLFCGSGVISTLYKIKTIWGDDAIYALLEFIAEYLGKWIQNDDCRYWLGRNKENYQNNHPDFDKFFKDNVADWLN